MTRRLLIVEDESTLLEAIQDYFITLHWEADAAASLKEAELRLAERRYDLVVTDLSLRGGDGDGLTLAGKIRRSHPRTPVVVLTARDIRAHQRAAAAQGVRLMLQKPIALGHLSSIAERILEEQATG
jgi:two-component system response regulator PilR (NtrC family)